MLWAPSIGTLLGKGTHGVHIAMPWFVTILLLAFSAGIIVLLIVRYKLGQEKAIIVPAHPSAGGKKQMRPRNLEHAGKQATNSFQTILPSLQCTPSFSHTPSHETTVRPCQ